MSHNDDHSAPRNPNFLQRQLERARFERALEIAQSMVDKGAFLNTAELGRINNVLRGQTNDPWREGPTSCVLPFGRTEKIQVLEDPIKKAKELLTKAKQKAEQDEVVEAAAELYSELVLSHVFKDANRRTAVVAVAYLFKLYGIVISAVALHELGLGDLRVPEQKEALKDVLKSMVKLSPMHSIK